MHLQVMTNDRMAVLNTIAEQGLMSLHQHPDPELAFLVAERIHEGGGRVLEFTNRFPQAISTFSKLASMLRDRYPDMILGTGSVEDQATAALFINAGAEFIVSPGLDSGTALLCNRHKVPYLPGTMTITEIAEAESLGCEYVKLYPAMDPMFVTAVQMPRPWTRIVANGPIGLENLAPWFQAGATAIGTMAMAPPDVVADGRYDEITSNVQAMLTKITEVRSSLRTENPDQSEQT